MMVRTISRAGMLRGAVKGALAALFAATMMGAPAQAAPAIQGVWKITTPTNTLKPVSGEVPFTALGRKTYDSNKKLKAAKKYDDYDITLSRCSNPGPSRLMLTSRRFKIWNQQDVLTFDFEWNRAIRQIDLQGIPVKTPLVPDMTGLSVGHWEGDTLVATTTDISDRSLIDDLVPHGYDLKVTERYRLIDADTLENRMTFEDPEYFTKPWDAVVTYKRQPEALFAEDVCLDRIQSKKPSPAWP